MVAMVAIRWSLRFVLSVRARPAAAWVIRTAPEPLARVRLPGSPGAAHAVVLELD